MKIREYLEQQRVPFEVHEHPPAYTAQEVAAEEHVSGDILAKTVLVKADDNYVLCVLPASFKLDMQKIALAVQAKTVRLADENEIGKLFSDVEIGAEPPFGDLYGVKTLADEHLARHADIVFQAGTHREAIRMKYADYVKLAKPDVLDLAVHL